MSSKIDRVLEEGTEAHYRDACYVEFTYESGELWLLQVRPGKFGGAAAIRVATVRAAIRRGWV